MYSTPLEIDLSFLNGDKALKIENSGIHSALLSEQGKLYTFGCGSDGRLGHPEYEGSTYLYKESHPKLVETLAPKTVLDVVSSYYHMVAIVKDWIEIKVDIFWTSKHIIKWSYFDNLTVIFCKFLDMEIKII